MNVPTRVCKVCGKTKRLNEAMFEYALAWNRVRYYRWTCRWCVNDLRRKKYVPKVRS